MSPEVLLTELAARGVTLSAEDGLLHYRAPKGVLSPELRRKLSEQKGELVALLSARQAQAPVLSHPTGRDQPFALTALQLTYWAGRGAALDLGRAGHHIYIELDVLDLDLQRFHQALHRLIARHEMLRALILPDGQQRIQEHVPALYATLHDLSDCDPQQVAESLEQIRQTMVQQVLPVDRWPCYQPGVTRLPARRSRIHLSIEALFLDMESIERLIQECALLYANPDAVQEPLACSFRAYVLALEQQQPSLYERSRAYWLARLADLPAAPDLPLARPFEALDRPRCIPLQGRLEAQDWARLKQRAARMQLAPSALLLTAFAEALAASCQHQRFSLSLISTQRQSVHPQVADPVGMFASMTVLAIEPAATASFEERARRLQAQIAQGLDHWQYSGVHVLREMARSRNEGARPLLPVVFACPATFPDSGQPGATASWPELVYCTTFIPGVWLHHQVVEHNGALIFCWSAIEHLFPPGLVETMLDTYLRRLRQLAHREAGFTYEIQSSSPTQALEVSFGRTSLREDLDTRPALSLAQYGPQLPLSRYMQRVSYRVFGQDPLPLAQLSSLLAVLTRTELDGLPKYLYPSAGGIYPVQVYLALKARRMAGVEAGMYYYNPSSHQLVQLSPREHVHRELHAPINQPVFESAAFSLFLLGQLRSMVSVYGQAARDFALLEAGAISQLLITEAPRHAIGLCPIGDLAFGALRDPLALDEGHVLLHSLLGGSIDPAASTGWSFLPT
ncbi:MAG TPA: condensation domain-containing protein [Ktedonobacteraceae bacterium]|jgi:SagB-type dehydrogenase family enzyme